MFPGHALPVAALLVVMRFFFFFLVAIKSARMNVSMVKIGINLWLGLCAKIFWWTWCVMKQSIRGKQDSITLSTTNNCHVMTPYRWYRNNCRNYCWFSVLILLLCMNNLHRNLEARHWLVRKGKEILLQWTRMTHSFQRNVEKMLFQRARRIHNLKPQLHLRLLSNLNLERIRKKNKGYWSHHQ